MWSRGDIFPCKMCPRSFHPACVGLSEVPSEWFCDNCSNLVQKEKALAANKNAKAAGRQAGVESIEQIMKRAIRIVPTSDDFGGCALCKVPPNLLATMESYNNHLLCAEEFCKNIVLAGVGSLSLMDDHNVTEDDLNANFLIPPDEGIYGGRSRADICCESLKDFNQMVRVSVEKGDPSLRDGEFIDKFDIVVVSCATLKTKELKGNIRVFCRVRPLLSIELGAVTYPKSVEEKGRGFNLIHSDQLYSFTFDKVFDHLASQEDVFIEISQQVQSVIDDHKVCIFAYGQTGSGKTHTIMGNPEVEEQKRLLPKSLEQIFEACEVLRSQGCNYTKKIYQDTIRDLCIQIVRPVKVEIL